MESKRSINWNSVIPFWNISTNNLSVTSGEHSGRYNSSFIVVTACTATSICLPFYEETLRLITIFNESTIIYHSMLNRTIASWYLAQIKIASSKFDEISSDNSIQLNRCANTSSVAMHTSLVPVANPSTSKIARAGATVCPLVGEGGGVTVPERLCNFVVSFRSTKLKRWYWKKWKQSRMFNFYRKKHTRKSIQS